MSVQSNCRNRLLQQFLEVALVLGASLWQNSHMSARATTGKQSPFTGPEFAVRREGFDQFFDKPMPRSTFHDMVNRGIIIPMKGLKGFYKLNESLCRMGLKPVQALPEAAKERTMEEMVRMSFSLIDPLVFPAPSWLLSVSCISECDAHHAALIAEKHAACVDALPSPIERIHYFQGVLDACHIDVAVASETESLP